MADGAWQPASRLLALLFNINRDPKKTPEARPDQFNPYADPARARAAREAEIIRVPLRELRGVFFPGSTQ